MSGDKQHYIPQFLLRNFGSRKGRRPARVVVYRRNTKPFSTATFNIAAERHFYSQPSTEGEKTLDDEITSFENRLAVTLDTIANSPINTPLDSEPIAEAITHLCIRQASTRQILAQAMNRVVDLASSTFTDETNTRKALGLNGSRATGQTLESFEELYEKHRLALQIKGFSTKEAFVDFAFRWTKENFKSTFANQKEEFGDVLGRLRQMADQIPRDAHIKALQKGLAPAPRAEALAKMPWCLLPFPSGSLVLPDCIAIGIGPDASAEPLLFSTKPQTVIMPLRHDLAVIGGEVVNLGNFSAELVNVAFAKSSWDFFIAHKESPLFERLKLSIGSGTESKIADMFEKVVRDLGW